MGRSETSEEVRNALVNATWLTHWGLYKEHKLPGWPASHRPGKVPICVPTSAYPFGCISIRDTLSFVPPKVKPDIAESKPNEVESQRHPA